MIILETPHKVATDPTPANKVYRESLWTGMNERVLRSGEITWIYTPVPDKWWEPKKTYIVVRNQPVRKGRSKRRRGR